MVRLNVRTPSLSLPQDVEIECELSWSVLRVKEEIQNRFESHPRPDEQRLVYAGKLLENYSILEQVSQVYNNILVQLDFTHLTFKLKIQKLYAHYFLGFAIRRWSGDESHRTFGDQTARVPRQNQSSPTRARPQTKKKCSSLWNCRSTGSRNRSNGWNWRIFQLHAKSGICQCLGSGYAAVFPGTNSTKWFIQSRSGKAIITLI